MSEGGWEELAEWYDAKQGDGGDPWHRSLIDPALLGLLGPVRGQRLLDLGCGNGYLARRFAREGAAVTAVDASARMVDRARAHGTPEGIPIDYRVAEATDLAGLASAGFDRVVANMVMMNLPDPAGALGEIARVLAPGGRFVFSISHPCFDVMSRSRWDVGSEGGRTVVRRVLSGYRTPFEEDVPWKVAPDAVRSTRSYHRPLGWWFTRLRDAGFVVEDLVEPTPDPELVAGGPPSSYLVEFPFQCVFRTRR